MGSSSRTAAADCGEISALGWLALILLFLKHMNNHATQSLCTWALLMISGCTEYHEALELPDAIPGMMPGALPVGLCATYATMCPSRTMTFATLRGVQSGYGTQIMRPAMS